jgi:hypothetical protein
MGDNNVGGGGSVKWRVRASHPKRYSSETIPTAMAGGAGLIQSGSDAGGDDGDEFTVSIVLPEDDEALDDFKNRLALQRGKVRFNIPITNNPNQIVIQWPEPKGARVAAWRRLWRR